MERVKQIARGFGKVSLALLGGVLMPILTLVALGVAVNQRVQKRRLQRKPTPTIGEILATAGLTIQGEATTDKAVAAKIFKQRPVTEIRQLLARAGLTIHDEAAPTVGEILAAAGLTIQEEGSTDKAASAKVFMQQPVTEIGQLLARAGLTIHDEVAPKHCWEILQCSPEKREACPAYARRDLPSWVAIGLGKGGQISEVCVNSTLLDLKTLPLQT